MDHLEKNKERIKKFKETDASQYIYQNELDKDYEDFKDLTKRTAADKVFRDKAFNIAKNPKYDEYQCGLASMVYKCFDKKTSGGVVTLVGSETLAIRNTSAVKIENMSNNELADKLHKPIIRKVEKRNLHSSFIDNICGADLADM